MENTAEGEPRGRRITNGLLAILVFIIVTLALKSARDIIAPLVFGFFLAVLVSPIGNYATRGLPRRLRWLGVLAALFVVLTIFVTFAAGIALSITAVSNGMNKYYPRIQEIWYSLMATLRSWDIPFEAADINFYALATQAVGYIRLGTFTILSLIAGFVLVLFLMALMLSEKEKWRRKAHHAFGDNSEAVLSTVEEMSLKLRRFILMHSLLSLSSGVATGLMLWLLDIDFALMWGFLTFLLNFIPYIGSVVAAIPPVLLALIQHGPAWALLVIAGLVVINLVNDNYLIPLVEGRALEISPLMVLISVVYWGWVWGIAGAFLATPLTAAAMVAFSHSSLLKPLALLISGSAGEGRPGKAPPRKK